jgi:hypothetical protein
MTSIYIETTSPSIIKAAAPSIKWQQHNYDLITSQSIKPTSPYMKTIAPSIQTTAPYKDRYITSDHNHITNYTHLLSKLHLHFRMYIGSGYGVPW